MPRSQWAQRIIFPNAHVKPTTIVRPPTGRRANVVRPPTSTAPRGDSQTPQQPKPQQPKPQQPPNPASDPSGKAEIVGNAAAWKTAIEWLQKRATDTSPKVLILKGPSGVGKTSGAHLLAAHCGRALNEINASDATGESELRHNILEGCCRAAITPDGCCNNEQASLSLIDDLEAFTPEGLKVVGNVVLNIAGVTGVIVTCGPGFRIPPSWPKVKYQLLKLQALSIQELVHIARCDPYFAAWNPLKLSEIAKRANGDARRLQNLMTIEKLDGNAGLKTTPPMLKRHPPQDPFEATQRVLYGRGMTAERALESFNTDPIPLVSSLVFTNYVHALTAARVPDMDVLASAAERMVDADVLRTGPTREMTEHGKMLFGSVGMLGGVKMDTPSNRFLEMPPKQQKVAGEKANLYSSYQRERQRHISDTTTA